MAVPMPEATQNLSRYRSARQKAGPQSSAPSTVPPSSFAGPAPTEVNSIQRSRSRYRRTKANTTSNPALPTNAAAQIAFSRAGQPDQPPRLANGDPAPLKRSQAAQAAQAGQEECSRPSPPPHAASPRLQPDSALPVRTKTSRDALRPEQIASPDERARLDAKRLMQKEAARQRKLKETLAAQKEREKVRQRQVDESRQRDAEEATEAKRLQEEEAKRQAQESIARQRQQLSRSRHDRDDHHNGRQNSWERHGQSSAAQLEQGVKSAGSRELFGMFKRKRGETAPQAHNATTQHPSRPLAYSTPFQDQPAPPNASRGIDAPVSAVNAGDRQVQIDAQGGSICLPVTPTTTPIQLLRSAANCLGGNIDPRSSVLMENFGKVGVQRPLRKYEHVRDVINSWDDDRQNSLALVPSATGGQDHELEASSVPSAQPEEFTCQLSYSQRPGKWDKRWITLRQDGQVTVAKKHGAKQSDQTNVCHLSDFDIYTPMPKQLARKIRPPKKHCFAIKSQQKSNLFMSMESFVHFFCSNDKKAASSFYCAVQSWRSWYLVNVLGEGQKTATKPDAHERRVSNNTANRNASNGDAHMHGRVASNDSHYQIGSFKPLIDLDGFDTSNENGGTPAGGSRRRSRSFSGTRGQGFSFATGQTRASGERRNAPPSAFPAHLSTRNNDSTTAHAESKPTSPSDEAAFAPTGLLGRTYSKRQAEAQARDGDRQLNAFTAGPSHTLEPLRRRSIDNTGLNTSSDPTLKRSSSQRRPIKPLVDLTPQYREPPQYATRGKGHLPDAIGANGLVDAATSPEEAVPVPPSTDWQRRTNTVKRPTTSAANGSSAESPNGMNNLARGKSVKRSGGGTRVDNAWRQSAMGMGFQAGSLLDQVQKQGKEHFSEGPAGLKWDRSRAEERTVAYGEAA